MKFLTLASLSMAVLLLACDDSDQTPVSGSQILIVDSNAGFPTDELRVESIRVDRDILTAEVRYGGGCGDIEFKLLGYSGFMESIPVQSRLTVSFKDEDPCEALLSRTIQFNLRPLAEKYKKAYRTNSGTILLRIDDYEPLVRYTF
jgi:hypothetical protein